MGESVDDESYTENTLRTVEIDDLSDPSRKDNKMSIDGIESANPYPLYSHSGDDGTWLQFALGFLVVLLLGIVGVICACIFHAQMRKRRTIVPEVVPAKTILKRTFVLLKS